MILNNIRRNFLRYLVPTAVSITALYLSYSIGFDHGYKEGFYQLADKFGLHDLLVLPEIYLKYNK